MTDTSIVATWAAARKCWRNIKACAAVDVVSELRAINNKIDAAMTAVDLPGELRTISNKIDALDYHSHGARAVYVGNNRVLMKTVVAGAHIAFLLEADDRLLTPWFIVSGRYETELTDFFVRHLKPTSHCIDVGASAAAEMRDGYPARRRFRQSAGEFFHCRRDMLMRLNSGAFTYLFVRTWHAFIPVGQRRGFKVPLGSSVLRNHIEAYGGRPVHAPKLALDFLGQPATMTSRQQSGTALL